MYDAFATKCEFCGMVMSRKRDVPRHQTTQRCKDIQAQRSLAALPDKFHVKQPPNANTD